MRKIISITAMLTLITLSGITTSAQDKEKKEDEKPKTSTVDTWRNALPVSEQPVTTSSSADETESNPAEKNAEVEKNILELEKRLMEALKIRDTETLQSLLADDFLLAGINIPGAKSDKVRFINWAAKSLELKNYKLEKTTVRAYTTTAIVSYSYTRQANIGGEPAGGNFVVTDVWIKRDDLWLMVSHHISQLPKP